MSIAATTATTSTDSSRREPGYLAELGCLAVSSVAKNTLKAAIPIYNICTFIEHVSWACYHKNRIAEASTAYGRAFRKQRFEAKVMDAVATFMVAVGSALLLVGLYYYITSDYTLSHKLFMIGGITTGAGLLLFCGAFYREWSAYLL